MVCATCRASEERRAGGESVGEEREGEKSQSAITRSDEGARSAKRREVAACAPGAGVDMLRGCGRQWEGMGRDERRTREKRSTSGIEFSIGLQLGHNGGGVNDVLE